MKKVIVTSAGGPCAENAIQSLRLGTKLFIIGTDVDKYMIKLSSADEKRIVHRADSATDMYIADLNKIAKLYKTSMLIPISDREIYVCALNRGKLPPMTLPSKDIILLCRDKGGFYQFLKDYGFPVPPFKTGIAYWNVEKFKFDFPAWVRAVVGAGGYLSRKVNNLEELKAWLLLNKKKKFMVAKYLDGRILCWTSLWKDGELIMSVLKERLRWVYNRIGTTAVQRTIYNSSISKICEEIIKTMIDIYEPDMTGLMMMDLKEDIGTGQVYPTEVNAGRTGTVSLWFGLASQREYGDQRANFWYQLFRIHHGLKPLPTSKNPLPPNYYYIRHIDMGHKLEKIENV